MKVYNITDVKDFLHRLDSCSGAVELSDERGDHFTIGEGQKAADLANRFGSSIPSAVLKFRNNADCIDMIGYLAGMRAC